MMDSLVPHMPRIKSGLHIAQAVFIFVAWALSIGYLVHATFVGSSIAWYFALCFISAPAIVYNGLTLVFARSRRWANPYAFAALDVVFAIFWLSAFAAVAAWNTSGACIGACNVSKAMVGFGFFVWLFFILTSVISVYGVIYYRDHGSLPGARIPTNVAMIDPDRDAFSTAPHDDEYAPIHGTDKDDNDHNSRTDLGGSQYGSSYGGAYAPPQVDDETSSFSNTNYGPVEADSNTSYGGAAGDGRVRFPSANY